MFSKNKGKKMKTLKEETTYRIFYVARNNKNVIGNAAFKKYYFTGEFDKSKLNIDVLNGKSFSSPIVSAYQPNAKAWTRLSSFAAFLGKHNSGLDKNSPAPKDLLALFLGVSTPNGKTLSLFESESLVNEALHNADATCYVEVTTKTSSTYRVTNIESSTVKCYNFADWYKYYWKISDKYALARKTFAGKSYANTIKAELPVDHFASVERFLNIKNSADTVNVKANVNDSKDISVKNSQAPSIKNTKWETVETDTVKRALTLASRFVPNLSFDKFDVHPKNQEQYAIIEISGKKYALLKI